MKRHYFQRFMLAVLAVALMAASAQAAPMTSAEKEQMYTAAILDLETYLEGGSSASSLAGVEAVFSQLGRYEQSQPLMYYTRLLQKLEADEYDYDVTIQLEMLENNTTFQEYLNDTLKGSAIGSVEKLKTYIEGRQNEYQGHSEAALASYRECMDYFDTTDRYLALKSAGDETRYTTALYLTQLGDYAGAYFAFAQTNGYKDSNERRQAIISLLGYVPASETDNPEPVTELKAECKAAEATLTWNKPKHTSAFQAAFRKKGTEQWYTADCTASTYTFTNLTPDTEYEFAVTAWAGKVEVGTRYIQANTKAPDLIINDKNFPDNGFRKYVSEYCDVNHDGLLSEQECSSVTTIDCHMYGISKLTGIECFTKLESLNCSHCWLKSLDVSKNTALIELRCSQNMLTSLDVSKNTALVKLSCTDNGLTSLILGNNTALTHIECYYNKLMSLDVSHNTALRKLQCMENDLTSLDVSKNTLLDQLYCQNNKLASLDVSKNVALSVLYCSNNKLTSLDVSNNKSLWTLDCGGNDLADLALGKNTVLYELDCRGNKLTALDVSNLTSLEKLQCNGNKLTTLNVSKNTKLTKVSTDTGVKIVK